MPRSDLPQERGAAFTEEGEAHMASLLERLDSRETWERFYAYKTSLVCPKGEAEGLRRFIEGEAYRPVCAALRQGAPFPLPVKKRLTKLSSGRKRTVYSYPEPENTVLKLLTWLLLREYDGLFGPGLYSFRPGRTAKDAIRALRRVPGLGELYAYKADIHDYFNSISVTRLLPLLEETVGEDQALFAFLRRLLEEPEVLERGVSVRERKGVMAGTPLSAFYANLYLKELDRYFEELGVPYVRYSDDIILFSPDRETAETHAAHIRRFLGERGLELNPEKEALTAPGEGWTCLGFCCRGETVDVAEATVKKLKGKMRRKTRALLRWRQRTGAEGERAAAAFIRVFNRKLLESPMDNGLSWSHWFFSVINTAESLREIDRYAQDCLRILVSGRHTKGRYNVRYGDLKRLGYRSLVNAYYAWGKEKRGQEG